MTIRARRRLKPLLLILAFALTAAAPLTAEEPQQVAVIKEIEGRLEITRAGSTIAGEVGGPLFTGDELQTGENNRALIEFASDQSLVKITYGSTLRLTGQESAGSLESRMYLVKGLMWGKKIKAQPDLRIRTAVAILAVRGTEYFVKVNSDTNTEVVVKEGTIDVSFDRFSIRALKMSHIVLERGKAPALEGLSESELATWVQPFA